LITKSEISRKSIHFANAVVPLGYLFLPLSKFQVLQILGAVLCLFLIFDIGRMRNITIRKFFEKYFDWMLRVKEKKGGFTGATWVMIASVVVIGVFPKDIAILALLFMSFGDSFAAIFGIGLGKIKLGNKTLEGSLACLIACLIIGLFFPDINIFIKLGGAITATFIELLPIPVDDNFSIPFSSALAMVILGMFI